MAKRELWNSKIGFILASAGGAIGLGNIWKFPYVTGQNGGGAFVLVYLFCVLLLGLPIMCSEMLIGRHTHRNVINAMGKIDLVARRNKITPLIALLTFASLLGALYLFSIQSWLLGTTLVVASWGFYRRGFMMLGWLGAIVAFSIMTYYGVIGGAILDYIVRALSGGLNVATPKMAEEIFTGYINTPWRVLAGFVAFNVATGFIILGGVRAGIERVSKVLMPVLLILLLVVIVRSVTLDGAMEGVVFFLKPDLSKITGDVFLAALGQAFFSLSLGMAITITYGSYLGKKENIINSSLWVGLLDTIAALLAGLAIFPAVFAMGLEPGGGPGLIFHTLPATFNQIPGGMGWVWAALFFIMLTIAALTSAASILETIVSIVLDRMRVKRARFSRKTATIMALVAASLVGCLSVFSFASWEHFPTLKSVVGFLVGDFFLKGSWFDTLDNVISNWCLPVVALGVVLLVGWEWKAEIAAKELLPEGDQTFPKWTVRLWCFLVRFICPISIILVFLSSAGLL